MFCPNCGKHISDDSNSNFCDSCGVALINQEKSVSTHKASFNMHEINGFVDKITAKYVQSSLILALVGFISTFMSWIVFDNSRMGRELMWYFGVGCNINTFEFLSIQAEPVTAFALLFVVPLVGVILSVISYINNKEKLGRNAILVMGVGGFLTFLVMELYVGVVNEKAYAGLVSLGIGVKIWLVASILQIVLFVMVKKAKPQ